MPGLRRRAARHQHRPDARLLRRPHARRPAQPLPDRRRPQRRRTSSVQNLNLAAGPDASTRLEDRRSLVQHFDTAPAQHRRTGRRRRRWTASPQEAFEFVSGPAARRAFDINQEDPQAARPLRPAQLGPEHAAGPAAGRGRLDVRHRPLRRLGPSLGPARPAWRTICRWWTVRCRRCSATWTSAACWTTTLVVLCGEFSRTPKMNDGGNGGPPRSMGTPGRDHWGNSMFCLHGRRRRQGRPGRRLDRPPRHAPAHPAGHAVQHPRHDLPGARHRSEAATARPERPARRRCWTTRRRSANCCRTLASLAFASSMDDANAKPQAAIVLSILAPTIPPPSCCRPPTACADAVPSARCPGCAASHRSPIRPPAPPGTQSGWPRTSAATCRRRIAAVGG